MKTIDRIAKHNQKYDAIIEQMGGLERVAALVPFSTDAVKRALDSGDVHLNTLPLCKWDVAAGLIGDGIYNFNMRIDGWPRGLSLAERVCTLKRAAERLSQ